MGEPRKFRNMTDDELVKIFIESEAGMNSGWSVRRNSMNMSGSGIELKSRGYTRAMFTKVMKRLGLKRGRR